MARRPSRPLRKKQTPSSIDRLEPEIRELIAQLRIDKGYTINEIKRAVEAEIGKERAPSRSALGRHVRHLADVSAEMQQTRLYAEALAKEAGDKQGTELLDLNTQLLQNNMFKLMLAEKDGEGVQLSTRETKEFSEALRNIALARKNSLELVEKAKQIAREEARAEALEAVERVAAKTAGGMTLELKTMIKGEILGIEV